MNQHELQIPQLRCQLCSQDIEFHPYELELIEQTIQVCQKCNVYIAIPIKYFKSNTIKINELYKKKIELIMTTNKIFYKLKLQECKICLKTRICSKICKNDHFFCLNCLQYLILDQFDSKGIKCPHDKCNQEIDDYTIFQFVREVEFKQWVKKQYNFFCPNKSCKTILRFFPFQKLETQILQVDNNQSQCSSCKAHICTACWKKFEGTYIQHQNICKQDYYRNQILKQYIIENGIVQCPKCKFYSEQDCAMVKSKIQACSVCGTKFCLFCKSADLELFYAAKPHHYSCYCFYNFFQRRKFQLIILLIIQIILKKKCQNGILDSSVVFTLFFSLSQLFLRQSQDFVNLLQSTSIFQ